MSEINYHGEMSPCSKIELEIPGLQIRYSPYWAKRAGKGLLNVDQNQIYTLRIGTLMT